MEFYVPPTDTNSEFYVYMHFAEVVKLRANESRSFNITINGKLWYGPLSLRYLLIDTVYSTAPLTGRKYVFSILKTGNSTLPPIINAIEIYTVKDLPRSETDQRKSTYKLRGIHLLSCYMSDLVCLLQKILPGSTHTFLSFHYQCGAISSFT